MNISKSNSSTHSHHINHAQLNLIENDDDSSELGGSKQRKAITYSYFFSLILLISSFTFMLNTHINNFDSFSLELPLSIFIHASRYTCFLVCILLIVINFFAVFTFIVKGERLKHDISNAINKKFLFGVILYSFGIMLTNIKFNFELNNFAKLLIFVAISLTSLMTINRSYKKLKRKNYGVTSYISLYLMISVFYCLLCYFLSFSTEILITPIVNLYFNTSLLFIGNLIFTSITTIFITYFKDIVFALCYLIFEFGIILNLGGLMFYSSILMFLLILLTVIHMIVKHKSEIFGFTNFGETERILIGHNKDIEINDYF